MTQSLFHEEQRFRQSWLWFVLAIIGIPMLAVPVYAAYRQLLLGQPFGDRPVSDAGLAAILAFTLLVYAGMVALFVLARLDVDVTHDALLIRFRPFHLRPKRIALADIAEARKRRYRRSPSTAAGASASASADGRTTSPVTRGCSSCSRTGSAFWSDRSTARRWRAP